MSVVKFTEILRCSSEDTNYPSQNLLKSNPGKWICAKDNLKQSTEVEIRLSKDVTISFIDIGNMGSHSVDVLVGHSMRGNDFYSIIPTTTFMSIKESKQGLNKNKVEMFKKEGMMTGIQEQKWDTLKIVCRQPFNSSSQYGLSFITVKGISTGEQKELNVTNKSPVVNNQSALKSFFGLHNSITSPKAPTLSLKSKPSPPSAARFPKTVCNDNTSKTSSPKRGLSPAEQEKFIGEVELFLADIGFEEEVIHTEFIVSDLRQQLEEKRGDSLSKHEKKLFMMILTEIRCKAETMTSSKLSSSPRVPTNEMKCPNCNATIPSDIMPIHSKICTSTPTRIHRQNRKSVCFDSGISDDEAPSPSKDSSWLSFSGESSTLTTPKPTGSSSISKLPRRSGSYARTSTCTSKDSASSMPVNRKRSGSFKVRIGSNSSEIDDLEIDTETSLMTPEVETPRRKRKAENSVKCKVSLKESFKTRKGTGTSEISKLKALAETCNTSKQQPKTKLVSNEKHEKHVVIVSPPIKTSKIVPTATSKINEGKKAIVVKDEKVVKGNDLPSANGRTAIDIPSTSSSARLVECPLCFDFMDENRINVHAALCEGKETTSINTSTSSKDDSSNHGDENNTQACPICEEQISIYTIGYHAMLCTKNPAEVIVDDEEDDLPTVFRISNITGSTPSACKDLWEIGNSLLNKTSVTSCPICSADIENAMIEFHVNMCLDRI